MINLIVAYYENIWPFKDTCCSLIFDEWKYLIKAPIGSGKSFLFFDAPRYALYKDSSRNMLNLQSKDGEISLIFDVDWAYFMVKRFLKHTSAWNDSCSSQLFMINYDGESLLKDIKNLAGNTEILQWWENIIEKFESQNRKLWEIEEISLKNETDVQNRMKEILPSKDVFLNTVFLLQDADNIFDEWDKDRIDILKRAFDLLWFDGAVGIVKERKKDVELRLKALLDTSSLDEKLRKYMTWLYNIILKLKNDEELKTILSQNDDFFEPIEENLDKLLINNFTLNWFDKIVYENVEKLVQKRMEVIIKMDAQLNEFQQQLSNFNQQKLKNEKSIQDAKLNISDLQKKIENIDIEKWDDLKKKKLELYQKNDLLDKNIDYSVFSELINFWNKSTEKLDNFDKLEMPMNLKSAYDAVRILRENWKILKTEIENVEKDLKNLDLQSKYWNEKHDRDVEKLKELKSRKDDEIKLQQNRIEELDKMWAENSDFDCPDLCKKCPHISAINKQQYENYSQQKEKLKQTLEVLKSDYEKQDFEKKIKELENQKNPDWEEQKRDFEKKIQWYKEIADKLREYLMDIWFAEWENSYREWESIQNDIKNIDKQIFQRETESKNLEKYKQDKIAAETSIQHLEKTLQEYDSQINGLNAKIMWVKHEKENANSLEIQQQQTEIKQIFQYISNIETLIQDNLDNANLVKKLTEEKKKLKNLVDLLSSDVILFALWQYLPALSDIINNYLSQCVDYSIKMDAVEKDGKGWNREIELEVKILDSKWEREVKSLSGGQRTVLKLVWMLAVSSYLHTPLLFLDETINNLDADTVWKVSEMINNFVKQRTMKFYTVTHNKEIQDMQIWDDVIEVNQIEKSE